VGYLAGGVGTPKGLPVRVYDWLESSLSFNVGVSSENFVCAHVDFDYGSLSNAVHEDDAVSGRDCACDGWSETQ
jgi:hypothetical protein